MVYNVLKHCDKIIRIRVLRVVKACKFDWTTADCD